MLAAIVAMAVAAYFILSGLFPGDRPMTPLPPDPAAAISSGGPAKPAQPGAQPTAAAPAPPDRDKVLPVPENEQRVGGARLAKPGK